MELDHKAGQKLEQKTKGNNRKENWKHKLQYTEKGNIKKNRHNVQLILQNDEKVQNIGRLNEFSGHNEIFSVPEWRRRDDANQIWTDTDDAQLRIYLDKECGIPNQSVINDCINSEFYNNAYHPIRDYLKSVSWDGVNRVETLFIDFLGAKDYKYTRTVTRKMLSGAVARVFEPGVKFDTVLILLGRQDIGKSHMLSRLGGKWFNESLKSFKGDESLIKLRNSWIIELSELSAMKAAEVEEVKSFISARVDHYRPKYNRNIAQFPRQCVFFGSTNNFEFLKDKTGNRRFWPLPVNKENNCKDPFEDLTDEYVDQLWAEAYHLYRNGEQLYLKDQEVRNEAERLQNDHMSDDGLAGIIGDYIKDKDVICARQIWHECLGNLNQPKRYDVTDINQVMRGFGDWKEKRLRFEKYGLQRAFVRR